LSCAGQPVPSTIQPSAASRRATVHPIPIRRLIPVTSALRLT
jgi:hypothetical protein